VTFLPRETNMPSERSQASREEVAHAIREIRAYHDQGRQSLRELPERGKHGARVIEAQEEHLVSPSAIGGRSSRSGRRGPVPVEDVGREHQRTSLT
jgi:hypothetical protein